MKLPDLPVLDVMPSLREALARSGAAVLASPPGSGKTTVAPLALLDAPWLEGRRILMLEPRRLAARASAARMASLLGESVGQRVGFQVRFDRRIGPETRIEVITEGLLTRRLQADPELTGVGLVIFDEFHERSLDVDLALALTLDARRQLVPHLKILVMSATLDTAAVSALLDQAPVVESAGRLHPVQVSHRSVPADRFPEIAVAESVQTALGEGSGDVLVFLPGAREIHGVQRRLEGRCDAVVHLLYGDLSSGDQDRALLPSRDGSRKVILATNIAQTSLTVEGVTSVVDSGLRRTARFDLGAGANRLITERVSRATADQRTGRAGRLAPGQCWRLWGAEEHGRLAAHDDPEIRMADLTRFALELAGWGTPEPDALALLDAPPEAAWGYAREVLRGIGAVGTDGGITAHGRALLKLPAPPRIGHMLLEARRRGRSATAAWTAAVLDERDRGGPTVDLGPRIHEARTRLQSRRVGDAAAQLLRMAPDGDGDVDEDALGVVVALAFPERVARRRNGRHGVYQCADGGEARLSESDPLASSEWLAIAHWDPDPPRKVRLAAALSTAQVHTELDSRISVADVVRWDAAGASVVAERQQTLGRIVLSRRPLREQGSGEAIARAMLEGVQQLGIGALPWARNCRQWQARVLSLRAWRPEEHWPDVSDDALTDGLGDWLLPWLDGVTRRDHLARLDLAAILTARLDHGQQRQLAELAPTHVSVPSGSRVALVYSDDAEVPTLSVKLQELFGCRQAPAVNGGRTPLKLELLSPARRPVAVTQDLAGFWARGYADVRKDLRGRYPKHPWPEDPLAAVPTRRAKRRSWP